MAIPAGIPTLRAVTEDAFNFKYLFLKAVSFLLICFGKLVSKF